MRCSFFCTFVLLVCAVFAVSGFAQEPAETGIAGGSGGVQFSDMDIPAEARILEVHVYSGEVVDAVQMLYGLRDGRSVLGPRHGGRGGRINRFRLDSDEYIIALSGRSGDYIDSIRIHTNKRTSPIFGGPGGARDYRIDIERGNQAIGFTGRAGRFLDAIGLTYVPIPMSQVGQTIVAGGRGGSAFDDEDIPSGARISEVRIYAGNNIDGIQAVYRLRNGRTIEGPFHGGTGGNPSVLRLDSDEYIVEISGRHGIYIDSMVIRTNKRTSQVFGGRGGSRAYKVEVPARTQAIGFVGRAGEYIDAIGLKYAPAQNNNRNQTPTRRRPNRNWR